MSDLEPHHQRQLLPHREDLLSPPRSLVEFFYIGKLEIEMPDQLRQ